MTSFYSTYVQLQQMGKLDVPNSVEAALANLNTITVNQEDRYE